MSLCPIPNIYKIAISMKKHITTGEGRRTKILNHIGEHVSVRFGTTSMEQM